MDKHPFTLYRYAFSEPGRSLKLGLSDFFMLEEANMVSMDWVLKYDQHHFRIEEEKIVVKTNLKVITVLDTAIA